MSFNFIHFIWGLDSQKASGWPRIRHPWQGEWRPRCRQGDPQGCSHSPWKINFFNFCVASQETWRRQSSPRSWGVFSPLSSLCTQLTSLHCSSGALKCENRSVLGGGENVTCVNKVDNGLVFGKKEWGGGCCTEHWSAELRGHRLKKGVLSKRDLFDPVYIALMLDSNATVRWEQILKPCGRTAWNAGGRRSCAASGSACSCRSWPRSPWTRPCLSRQAAVFHRSLKFQS